jgi:hypothetical protein
MKGGWTGHIRRNGQVFCLVVATTIVLGSLGIRQLVEHEGGSATMTAEPQDFLPLQPEELSALGGGRSPTWGQLEDYFALTEAQLESSIRASAGGSVADGAIDLNHYRIQRPPADQTIQIALTR